MSGLKAQHYVIAAGLR